MAIIVSLVYRNAHRHTSEVDAGKRKMWSEMKVRAMKVEVVRVVVVIRSLSPGNSCRPGTKPDARPLG